MPSAALETLLQTRLVEIDALEAIRPTAIGGDAFRQAQAINRAAVVLTSAHFEGFLEDLIGDCVDALNDARPPTERLPRTLLAAHVRTDIDEISEMTDVHKAASRIDRLFNENGSFWLEPNLTQTLRAAVIAAHINNPGSRVIEAAFVRLGIEDALSGITLSDGSEAAARVNEFVSVRNAIAHGESVSVTDDQVSRYAETVEVVGRALDASAADFVKTVTQTPTLPWT